MTLILNFHGLGEPFDGVEPDEVPYWLSPVQFECAIDQLRAAEVPFQVTLDDGNLSDYTIGLPGLVERGLGALFFVCSDRIGKPRYLDVPHLRAIAATPGCGIGTHGLEQCDWTRLSRAALAEELSGSRRRLEDVSGSAVTAAGIPFGLYNRRVLKALAVAGYTELYSSDKGPKLGMHGVMPRLSLRSDRSIAAQVDRLIAGRALHRRVLQELKMTVKSLR